MNARTHASRVVLKECTGLAGFLIMHFYLGNAQNPQQQQQQDHVYAYDTSSKAPRELVSGREVGAVFFHSLFAELQIKMTRRPRTHA